MLSPDAVALPLRFVATGILALVIGSISLVARPNVLASYHYNQWAVAITHIFTLGWLGSILIGAMYQLVPVALETTLHRPAQARFHFWLHVAAWPGMVAGFWIWSIPTVALFGTLFVAGMFLFGWNMTITLRTAPRSSIVATGVALAIGWGVLTAAVGLLVALAKLTEVSLLEPLALMHAHAHLGAIGFFTTMLMAVSYKLLPMFCISEVQNPRRAQASLWLLTAGLLGGIFAMLVAPACKLPSVALALGGLACYGAEIVSIVRRRNRPLDSAIKQFLVALALIAPAGCSAVVLSWPGLPPSSFTTQLENVYGVLMFVGVLTLSIMAMLHKIVPFLVWYSAYSRHIGRSKVPSLANLSSPALQAAMFASFLPAIVTLCAGALLESEVFVQCGALLLLASVAALVANIVLMVNHLRRPRIEPLVRPAKQAPA